MSHPIALPVWTGPADVHGYPTPTDEELTALAAGLSREQRDLLGRAWASQSQYVWIAQDPAKAAVLRDLVRLGLVLCSSTERGPSATARGRTVIGRLPQRIGSDR